MWIIIFKIFLILNLSYFSIFRNLIAFAITTQNKDCYYQTLIINAKPVYTLTINPKKYKIINASANSINRNTAYVAQIARKFKAIMGINGGFFRAIDQDHYLPAGILKIDHIWHGIAYQTRGCIGWDPNSNNALIDRISTITSILLDHNKLPVDYFNPNTKHNNSSNKAKLKIIVYSNIYPDFNSLIDPESYFPIYTKHAKNYMYRLDHTNPDYSLAKTARSTKLNIEIIPQLAPEYKDLWENFAYITNGTPVLLKNYKILTDYHNEKLANNFIHTHKARTAIGILGNGFWKFVLTQNMTIPELANVMQLLQCTDALNLDGGSSSDLYLSTELGDQTRSSALVHPVTDVILVLPI